MPAFHPPRKMVVRYSFSLTPSHHSCGWRKIFKGIVVSAISCIAIHESGNITPTAGNIEAIYISPTVLLLTGTDIRQFHNPWLVTILFYLLLERKKDTRSEPFSKIAADR